MREGSEGKGGSKRKEGGEKEKECGGKKERVWVEGGGMSRKRRKESERGWLGESKV